MKRFISILLFASACLLNIAATVNVGPGDNAQAKINGSVVGDTVNFTSINISRPLSFPGGRTYTNGPVNYTGTGALGSVNGNDAKFVKLTLSGGGLSAAQNTSGLLVDSCTIKNIPSINGPTDAGIFFNGLIDSSVVHTTFTGCYGDACILGYNPLRCKFNDNYLDTNHEGFHFFYGTTAPQPCFSEILRNVFIHTVRYSLEQQGCPNTLEIAYNWAEYSIAADHATMQYSLPLSDSGSNNPPVYNQNVHVHHNYSGGTGLVPISTTPVFQGGIAYYNQSWGFEAGQGEYDHNFVNGRYACAMCYTCTTPDWSYHDNVWAGVQPKFGGMVIPEFRGVPPKAGNTERNNTLLNMIAVPSQADITTGRYWNVDSGATTQPAPPVVVPDVALTVHATLNLDGTVTVSWTGVGPLYIRGSLPTDKVVFQDAPRDLTLGNINNTWTVWIGDGSSEMPLTIAGSAVKAGAVFAPVIVTQATTQPSTQPTTMPADIHLHSDDGGMTWTQVK